MVVFRSSDGTIRPTNSGGVVVECGSRERTVEGCDGTVFGDGDASTPCVGAESPEPETEGSKGNTSLGSKR